jgi:hypothetical protein
MKTRRPPLIKLAAYIVTTLAAAFFFVIALQGISGNGLSIHARWSSASFPALPGSLLAIGFLCLSAACALPTVFLLLRRPVVESTGIAVFLTLSFFGLWIAAILFNVLSIGVPNDQPLTPMRVCGAIGIVLYLVYKFRQ